MWGKSDINGYERDVVNANDMEVEIKPRLHESKSVPGSPIEYLLHETLIGKIKSFSPIKQN